MTVLQFPPDRARKRKPPLQRAEITKACAGARFVWHLDAVDPVDGSVVPIGMFWTLAEAMRTRAEWLRGQAAMTPTPPLPPLERFEIVARFDDERVRYHVDAWDPLDGATVTLWIYDTEEEAELALAETYRDGIRATRGTLAVTEDAVTGEWRIDHWTDYDDAVATVACQYKTHSEAAEAARRLGREMKCEVAC
jgi:hypothetical protein